jgi:hypothetical protein
VCPHGEFHRFERSPGYKTNEKVTLVEIIELIESKSAFGKGMTKNRVTPQTYRLQYFAEVRTPSFDNTISTLDRSSENNNYILDSIKLFWRSIAPKNPRSWAKSNSAKLVGNSIFFDMSIT